MRFVTVEFVMHTDTAQGAVDMVERFIPDIRGIDQSVMESWTVVCVREMAPRVLRVEDGKVQED